MNRYILSIFILINSLISFAQPAEKYEVVDTIKVEEKYDDGKIHFSGQYLVTKESGKLKNGCWINYTTEGNVKDSTLYDFSKIIEEIKFHKNGHRQRHSEFKMDAFNNIKEQRFVYHENGQLKYQARYRNKKKYGGVNSFNKKGELISSRIYNKNKIIEAPREYRRLKHYQDSVAASLFWRLDVEEGPKVIKLKNGQITLIDLQDGSIIDFAKIDGFADGYMYYSQFTLNVSHKTKSLDFYKSDKLLLADIKSIIVFPKKRRISLRRSGKMPMDIEFEIVEE